MPVGFTKYSETHAKKSYIGQIGRSLTQRHRENIRYIKTRNPPSAYAMHILNNRHEYGKPEHNLQLLQSCQKGKVMNYLETLYIQ